MKKSNKEIYLELVKGITREGNVDYEEQFRTGGQTKMNI